MYRDLLGYWKRNKIPSTGATEAEVAQAELRLAVRFPHDFHRYLVEFGGAYVEDHSVFAFYSIDQLKRWDMTDWGEPSGSPATFRQSDFVVFGDYLQLCYGYAIRISGPLDLIGEVIHCGMLTYSPIATSFPTFISLYIADDWRLHTVRASSIP